MKKKTLIALAALSATAGAFAQSSVTIYGMLDASVAYVDNANAAKKSLTSVNDSALVSSRWGFRGTEDIGGGLKANFNLESDVNTGTGAVSSDQVFRRAAWVSLSSATWGELRLGRTMSTAIANSQGGVVAPGNAIGVSAALANGTGADFFPNNAISYYSPVISGVQGVVQYAPDEKASTLTDAEKVGGGRKLYSSLSYTTADLRLSASYADIKAAEGFTPTAKSRGRTWYNVNALYTVGAAKFGVTYYDIDHDEVAGATPDNSGYGVSAGYQLNPQTLLAATLVKSQQDSSLLNLQARYSLSKRTTMYAMISRADNGNKGVNFTPMYQDLSGGTPNTTQTGVALGVIHTF